jgi:hypothetical protein
MLDHGVGLELSFAEQISLILGGCDPAQVGREDG